MNTRFKKIITTCFLLLDGSDLHLLAESSSSGKLARSIPIKISAQNRSYKQASAITYRVDEPNLNMRCDTCGTVTTSEN